MKSKLPEDMRLALLGAAKALKEAAKFVNLNSTNDDAASAFRQKSREFLTHAKNLEDILFRVG